MTLRGLWLLHHKRQSVRAVSLDEFLADTTLLRGLRPSPGASPSTSSGQTEPEPGEAAEEIRRGLRLAVRRGVFLAHETGPGRVYFAVNNDAGHRAIARMKQTGEEPGNGSFGADEAPAGAQERPNIFALYEDTIGWIQPMMAERLKEAEERYPPGWIREAFEIAALENKRNWQYIDAILKRWGSEGKGGWKGEAMTMESLGDILRRISARSIARTTNGGGAAHPPETAEADRCATCNGSGWVTRRMPVGHPDFGQAVPCPSCRNDEESPARRDSLRRYSNLGALSSVTIAATRTEGPLTDPGARRMFAESFAQAVAYAEDPQGWLVLTGPSGSGKTHLAAAIANRCIERQTDNLFHYGGRPAGPPAGRLRSGQPHDLRRTVRPGEKCRRCWC